MKAKRLFFRKTLLYYSVIITVIIVAVSFLSYWIVCKLVMENNIQYQKSTLHHFEDTARIILRNAEETAYKQISLRSKENIFSDMFISSSIKKLDVVNDLENSYLATTGLYDVVLTDYEKYVYAANAGCSDFESSPYSEALNAIKNSRSQWHYSEITDYKYEPSGRKNKVNVIMRSLKSGKTSMSCVVLIHAESLKDIFKTYSARGYKYFIANQDVIVPVSGHYIETPYVQSITEYITNNKIDFGSYGMENSIIDILNIEGEKYHMCILSTYGSGWKYISIISLDDLNKSANKIKNTGIVTGAAGLFVSLLLLLFVSSKLYKPIQYIVEKISVHFNEIPEKSEMLYIDNALDKLIVSNKNAINALKDNESMIREGIISKVLSGNTNYDKRIFSEFAYYMVSVIALKSDGRHKKDIPIFIHNIFDRNINYNIAEIMEGIVILFMMKNNNQEPDDVSKYIDQLSGYLSENIDIPYVIGVGGLVNSIREIKNSYRQALGSCRFRLVKGWNTVIRHEDISISEAGDISGLKEIDEKYVIDLLSAGSLDKSLEYLGDLLLEYGRENCFNEKIIYSIYFKIISFLLNYMDNNGICPNLKFNIPNIMNVETLYEMKLNIKNILDYISSNLNTEMNKIMKVVGDYIQEHYNEDISLTLMADKVYLNESYLSKVFKKYYSVNFNEYLMEIRMKKACELLKSSNYSILKVAEMVGYYNISSFNKAFKKYSGFTPGGYRRMNCSNNMEMAGSKNTGI